jgi:hypothetical protein
LFKHLGGSPASEAGTLPVACVQATPRGPMSNLCRCIASQGDVTCDKGGMA